MKIIHFYTWLTSARSWLVGFSGINLTNRPVIYKIGCLLIQLTGFEVVIFLTGWSSLNSRFNSVNLETGTEPGFKYKLFINCICRENGIREIRSFHV